jgi:hypothetical protein
MKPTFMHKELVVVSCFEHYELVFSMHKKLGVLRWMLWACLEFVFYMAFAPLMCETICCEACYVLCWVFIVHKLTLLLFKSSSTSLLFKCFIKILPFIIPTIKICNFASFHTFVIPFDCVHGSFTTYKCCCNVVFYVHNHVPWEMITRKMVVGFFG